MKTKVKKAPPKADIIEKYGDVLEEIVATSSCPRLYANFTNSGNLRLIEGGHEYIYNKDTKNKVADQAVKHFVNNGEFTILYHSDFITEEELVQCRKDAESLRKQVEDTINEPSYIKKITLGKYIKCFKTTAKILSARKRIVEIEVMTIYKEDAPLEGASRIIVSGKDKEECINKISQELYSAENIGFLKWKAVEKIFKKVERDHKKKANEIKKLATKQVQMVSEYALNISQRTIMYNVLSGKEERKDISRSGYNFYLTQGWKKIKFNVKTEETEIGEIPENLKAALTRIKEHKKGLLAIIKIYEKEKQKAKKASLDINCGTTATKRCECIIRLYYFGTSISKTIDLLNDDVDEEIDAFKEKLIDVKKSAASAEKEWENTQRAKYGEEGLYQNLLVFDIMKLVELNKDYYTENRCVKMLRGLDTNGEYYYKSTEAAGKYALFPSDEIHQVIHTLIRSDFLREKQAKGTYGRYMKITLGSTDSGILFPKSGSMKSRRDFEEFTDFEWVEYLKDPNVKLSAKKWMEACCIFDRRNVLCLYPDEVIAFLKSGPESIREYLTLFIKGMKGTERKLYKRILDGLVADKKKKTTEKKMETVKDTEEKVSEIAESEKGEKRKYQIVAYKVCHEAVKGSDPWDDESAYSETRYKVIDPFTNETLDDAQGYGYRSFEKARAAFEFKKKDGHSDSLIEAGCWLQEHKDVQDWFDSEAFYQFKDPTNDGVDNELCQRAIDESGEDVSFSASSLRIAWEKGLENPKKREKIR